MVWLLNIHLHISMYSLKDISWECLSWSLGKIDIDNNWSFFYICEHIMECNKIKNHTKKAL